MPAMRSRDGPIGNPFTLYLLATESENPGCCSCVLAADVPKLRLYWIGTRIETLIGTHSRFTRQP